MSRQDPSQPSSTLKVLLVDSGRDTRIAIRQLLRDTGLQLEITVTPWVPTARALLDNPFDCLLVSTDLPDAFELIHDASMKTAVIALSDVDMSQAGPAVRAGAHDLLLKSELDPEALQKALTAAIDQRQRSPSSFHTEEPTQQVPQP